MTAGHIAILVVMLAFAPSVSYAQLAPLASGGAPPCSRKMGRRQFRSATASDAGAVAFITASAYRGKSGCQSTAQIHLDQGTKAKSIGLSDAGQRDFAIVDFSSDGKELLLSSSMHEKSPNEQFRYLQVAALPLSSKEIQWRNVWDLLGWKDCAATVEALGFTADGKLALRARPSVMATQRRSNCVSAPRLYAIDQFSSTTSTISNAAGIKRYGKVVSPATQACKSDPDLVGKCFSVQGRISAWNGNPTFRISPAGTKRILGVTDAPFPPSQPQLLPEPLEGKLNTETDASGDFYVCPFSVEKPGRMQMVCIESASNVTFKRH